MSSPMQSMIQPWAKTLRGAWPSGCKVPGLDRSIARQGPAYWRADVRAWFWLAAVAKEIQELKVPHTKNDPDSAVSIWMDQQPPLGAAVLSASRVSRFFWQVPEPESAIWPN